MAAKNKTIKQPKISPIRKFFIKIVALIGSILLSFEAIKEVTKNEIIVLKNAVKMAKKTRCWKISLLPSKKFESLKKFSYLYNVDNNKTIYFFFHPLNFKDYEYYY